MHNRTMHVDVTNKQIKGLKLGQKVTIVTKGEITELTAERDMGDMEVVGPGGKGKKKKKDVWPPNIQIEVSSTEVDNENAFSDLAD